MNKLFRKLLETNIDSVMKFTRIIKQIFSKELPKPIGRWRIEQCNKKMNSKIDLSNEDHCGPCGQYALTKIEFASASASSHSASASTSACASENENKKDMYIKTNE